MSFEPIQQRIRVQKTARYFMSGPITEQTRSVWLVLHGYGQQGGYFLKKFSPLFGKGLVFVAPEGLSRFYLAGSSGRVGASWMTSENRLDEIQDYVQYLDQLVSSLQLPAGVELGVLGFSQGVATVSRWVAMGQTQVNKIILYAGVFPPDLDPGFDSEKWKNKTIDVLIGDSDVYYRTDEFTRTYAALQAVNPGMKMHHFEGGHEIFAPVLRILME